MLELYNLKRDFSQSTDLAAKNPWKVKEMKATFMAEAKKDQVFPLDASVASADPAPAASRWTASWWPAKPWPQPCR